MFENILFIIVLIFSAIILIFSTSTIVHTKNMKNITCANCKNLILTVSCFEVKYLTCTKKDNCKWWKTQSITDGGAEKCICFENKNKR